MATARSPAYSKGWDAERHVKRTTVDFAAYPGLVVIYVGMRINSIRGIFTLLKFARRMREAVKQKPEGMLLHEGLVFSFRQFGVRQYWRDFETLEAWASAPPHRDWWREYLQDTKGTGFWHETYFLGGGMEAIYDNMRSPVGLLKFAPHEPPTGGMFTARKRLRRAAAGAMPLVEDEGELRPPPDEQS